MLVLSRREGETIILETGDGPIRVSLEMLKGSAAQRGSASTPRWRSRFCARNCCPNRQTVSLQST